jgi:hypothetical protein
VTWRSFELDPHAPRERAVDSTTLARGGNTFDAHRLVHLGDSHGLQDAIKERLMRAYFTAAGAHPPEALLELLRRGWEARPAIDVLATGATCDVDGC